jgi:hypothetical protein
MNPRIKDMTGKRCHRLTVITYAGSIRKPGNSTATWLCRCDCRKELIVIGWALRAGHTRSCGCARVAANKRR